MPIPPLVFSVRELSMDGLGVVADIVAGVTSVYRSTADRALQVGIATREQWSYVLPTMGRA